MQNTTCIAFYCNCDNFKEFELTRMLAFFEYNILTYTDSASITPKCDEEREGVTCLRVFS